MPFVFLVTIPSNPIFDDRSKYFNAGVGKLLCEYQMIAVAARWISRLCNTTLIRNDSSINTDITQLHTLQWKIIDINSRAVAGRIRGKKG